MEKFGLGDRVVIAALVNLANSDFHPLDPALRAQDCLALSAWWQSGASL